MFVIDFSSRAGGFNTSWRMGRRYTPRPSMSFANGIYGIGAARVTLGEASSAPIQVIVIDSPTYSQRCWRAGRV
jgi:hypothetical protein